MTFQPPQFLSLLSTLDLLAVAYLVVSMGAMTWMTSHGLFGRRPTGEMVAEYRLIWMRRAARRIPRVTDAALMGGLRANTAFFASSSLIAIGGVIAVFGNVDRLNAITTDLFGAQGMVESQEVKLLVVVLILVYGFLKFVWSQRVFGYCSVVLGAMPGDLESDLDEDLIEREVKRAARLNSLAARNFNKGLRSIYYALATMAWFLGPVPFLLAVTLTSLMMIRREFASNTREALRFTG